MGKADISHADSQILLRFSPFNLCDEDELVVLADHAWLVQEHAGHVLAELHSQDQWDIYLVEGELELESADGKKLAVNADSPAAKTPIAHLQPRVYTVRAKTSVAYIRVEKALLASLSYGASGQAKTLGGSGDGLGNNPLYAEIYDDLVNDRLDLPSLPEIAVRIQHLLEDDSVNLARVAKLVQSDLAISAKLLKVANGALYYGQHKVDSCAQAIVRLGMLTTRHLVLSFVLHNVFQKTIRDPSLALHAKRLWEHSVEVGTISQVLARVTPGLDPDEALLVGLLHDIGELVILTYVERLPKLRHSKEALDEVIKKLKGELGAIVLQEWCFSEPYVTAAKEAEDWYRDPSDRADYCDVVVVAQLHSFVAHHHFEGVPRLDEVPALGKLADGQLTPDQSMHLLEQAKEQVAELKHLLLA